MSDNTVKRPENDAERARDTSDTSDTKARDHLANERTLLAWGRTGIAVMGLEFIVARFGLLLRELGVRAPSSSCPMASPQHLGRRSCC